MSDAFTETAEQQGNLWSAAGQNWAERFAPLLAPVWATSHDLARVTAGTRLLDVGCGSGGALRLAQLRGAGVAGLDAAPDLLDIATERLPHGDLRRGDMEHLPYEDESFDAVTHINCIMYAEDPARAIREARRVLTSDGRLAMAVWSDPEVCEFRKVMEALRSVLPAPPQGDGPFTLSGQGALEAVMEAEGFEPVEARRVRTPFIFADQTHYLEAIHGTGPGQAVYRQVGEAAMTETLLDVGEQFVQDDGAYHLENSFRVIAAIPSID
ncbi:MAG: class I SAM-dependent methyltransferase [Natronomonas sp.]